MCTWWCWWCRWCLLLIAASMARYVGNMLLVSHVGRLIIEQCLSKHRIVNVRCWGDTLARTLKWGGCWWTYTTTTTSECICSQCVGGGGLRIRCLSILILILTSVDTIRCYSLEIIQCFVIRLNYDHLWHVHFFCLPFCCGNNIWWLAACALGWLLCNLLVELATLFSVVRVATFADTEPNWFEVEGFVVPCWLVEVVVQLLIIIIKLNGSVADTFPLGWLELFWLRSDISPLLSIIWSNEWWESRRAKHNLYLNKISSKFVSN